MTAARPRRTPSTKGFSEAPSPKDVPVKKKFISSVKEKAANLLVPTEIPSAVPKDFVFLSEVKTEDFSGLLSKIANTSYPTCCGAQIVHSFGQLAAMTPKQQVAALAAQVHYAEKSRVGMLIAIINYTQKPLIGKAFDECGFKLVSCTSNPNHSDTTTIYLYVKLIGNKDLDLDGKEKRKGVAA